MYTQSNQVMLYRKFRDNVVLPNMNYTNTQLKCKYPIHLTFKGLHPIPQKMYMLLRIQYRYVNWNCSHEKCIVVLAVSNEV